MCWGAGHSVRRAPEKIDVCREMLSRLKRRLKPESLCWEQSDRKTALLFRTVDVPLSALAAYLIHLLSKIF